MLTLLACTLLGTIITDGPPLQPAQVAPSSTTCDSHLIIQKGASLLDVTGELNGYPLALDKKLSAPAPGGALDVKLFGLAGCPTSEDQLVEPFTFTAESRGSLTVDPQAGFTVMAGRVIRFVVKDLQIKVTTPAPIAVNEANFDSADGVRMEITSGTAAALGRSISLVGRTASFPLAGFFSLTSGGALALSVTSSSATFPLDTQLGSTRVSGEVTLSGALEAAASVGAHALVADAVKGRLLSSADEVGGLRAGATHADRALSLIHI